MCRPTSAMPLPARNSPDERFVPPTATSTDSETASHRIFVFSSPAVAHRRSNRNQDSPACGNHLSRNSSRLRNKAMQRRQKSWCEPMSLKFGVLWPFRNPSFARVPWDDFYRSHLDLVCTSTVEVTPELGVAFMHDSLGFHKVGNPSDTVDAVTLHLYAPPYRSCRIWHDANASDGSCRLVNSCGYDTEYGRKVQL